MIVKGDEDLRAQAVRRLRAQRKVSRDVTAYVVVNAGLIVIWAVTGHGYFWPAWVLGIWGFFLVLDVWKAWSRLGTRPITEAEVEREVDRLRRHSGGGAAV